MSLVSNLISGSTGNFGMVDASKYGHATGALRIATESVEELHDIFIEGFYNMEQAELGAVHEGVALEGSQYEAIQEASAASVFAKVKEFFKKLWEKVKAFFHNIKRYIDAMFMSGKDFIKKYKKDIDNAKYLKDFEYKMYEYDDDKINNVESVDVETLADGIINKVSNIDYLLKEAEKTDKDKEISTANVGYYQKNGTIMSRVDVTDDRIAETLGGVLGLGKVTYDDFDTEVFKYFRNGAEDKSDMDDQEISGLSDYVNAINNFKSSALDKAASNTDKAYKKAIKKVDDLENKVSKSKKGEVRTAISKYLTTYSSTLSKAQTLHNKFFTAWKTAAKERDSAYKSMIVAAISYSKKQEKNK